MSELAPIPTTDVVDEPRVPAAPSACDSAPIPVLAEGTSPVAIAYRPAPRRTWPLLAAAIGVVAVAASGYTIYAKRDATRELIARYPIAASAAEQAELANGRARWSGGKPRLLASLAAFDAPDLATLKGIGACTLTTKRSDDEITRAAMSSAGTAAWDDRDLAISLRHMILPGETSGDLAAIARPAIDLLIAASTRARFQTTAARDHVLHAIGSAFVLVRVDELRMPELDRARDVIAPGVLAGTAYAFDPANGALRCAGIFRATSSTSVGALSSFSGLDRAQNAALRDFEQQIETSLVSSLRSID